MSTTSAASGTGQSANGREPKREPDREAGGGAWGGVGVGVVELRVAARPELVSTVRALVVHVAGRADYDLDTIADLQLAIDEACTSLIRIAAPGARLSCALTATRDSIDIAVTTTTASIVTATAAADRTTSLLDTEGFGWQLLRALTDHVELRADPAGRVPHSTIRFTKHLPGLHQP